VAWVVRGVFVGIAAASLVACSGGSSSQQTPAAQVQSSPAAVQATGDPLVRLVASMSLNTDQQFREPVTGQVLKVELVRAYDAASGRPCREYMVTDEKGVQQQGVACRIGDQWVRAHPLRTQGASQDGARQP
jgi:hypothetical protein